MDEENKVTETSNTETGTTTERKGFNITSLILGIISVVAFCWWYVAIPCGIIAIIFSIAGKKDAGRGMGVAGMVLGIIGLVLSIVIWILAIMGLAALSTMTY